MNNTATEGGALIRIKSVTSQFAVGHPTDGVDKVLTVEILEPILIRIVGVRATVELVGRRILNPVLVTSILGKR